MSDLAPVKRFADEYRFLSNFWEVPDGITFGSMSGATTEHVYQASKARSSQDAQWVLDSESPHQAKHRGREIEVREDWEDIRLGVMSTIQHLKYQNLELAELLLDTGHRMIYEGNRWHDIFWGVCSCEKHAGEGENWLGRILMIERSKLRMEKTSSSRYE